MNVKSLEFWTKKDLKKSSSKLSKKSLSRWVWKVSKNTLSTSTDMDYWLK